MFAEHYPALVTAYLAALAGWVGARRIAGRAWPAAAEAGFPRPWLELGISLAGAVGVLITGQLVTHGIRLPEGGPLGPVLSSINQLLIFLPMLAVIPLRRESWDTAWLSGRSLPTRLLWGIGLAVLAVSVYSPAREGADRPWQILGRIARYEHLDELAQVLLEDVAIAILFVRMIRIAGKEWAAVIVGALFAAGHIPAMLSQGASLAELLRLAWDAGLGAAIVLVLARSRDIVWFAPVHFCLDMTQFGIVTFGR
jgi:hypothetical protein